MPMNSGLTSALSAFSRRSSAFSKNPFAAEPNEPPLHPTELTPIRKARWWLGKVVPFAFVRFLTIFFIGVVTTLAWQFYGSGAREAIAGWSPHLGWLAPPPAPSGAPPDQLAAISRDLAVVRQNLDKLATAVTKLQATQQGAPDRTSAAPPPPAGPTVRRPAPPPARTAPVR